jgi:anaerobic selenocysteine-containing dehydrogenase
LRRIGAKGEGRFERMSWDAALDLIAGRWLGIIDRHGAETLRSHNYLGTMRLCSAARCCASSTRSVRAACTGISARLRPSPRPAGWSLGFDPEDMAESRLVLLWGLNVLCTCHHHWHFIQEARKRHGARVIALDPIRTRTARQCDEHIQLRPGSDAVLAAALAGAMLETGSPISTSRARRLPISMPCLNASHPERPSARPSCVVPSQQRSFASPARSPPRARR